MSKKDTDLPSSKLRSMILSTNLSDEEVDEIAFREIDNVPKLIVVFHKKDRYEKIPTMYDLLVRESDMDEVYHAWHHPVMFYKESDRICPVAIKAKEILACSLGLGYEPFGEQDILLTSGRGVCADIEATTKSGSRRYGVIDYNSTDRQFFEIAAVVADAAKMNCNVYFYNHPRKELSTIYRGGEWRGKLKYGSGARPALSAADAGGWREKFI